MSRKSNDQHRSRPLSRPSNSQVESRTGLVKFNEAVFSWPRNLFRSPAWSKKSADITALQAHLKAASWFSEGRTEAFERHAGSLLVQPLDYQGSLGVELFIGHLEDRRMWLLFSDDVLRGFLQRLYDAGEASRILPMPVGLSAKNREMIIRLEKICLLSHAQLRELQKMIDKQNKVNAFEEKMRTWAQEYEVIRSLWQSKTTDPTFIGFDVETHESGHDDILEVGWSLIGPRKEQETFHYIIEESYLLNLRNGQHVPDNRRHFLFGKVLPKPLVGHCRTPWAANGSEIASAYDIGRHFSKTVQRLRERGPVYVVFHASEGDMAVMTDLGIDTEDWQRNLLVVKSGRSAEETDKNSSPSATTDADTGFPLLSSVIDAAASSETKDKSYPVYIVDTQLLFAALRCNGKGDKKNLSNVCIALDVQRGQLQKLHNAANDAHYTAAALQAMATGPPLDDMRAEAERRMTDVEDKRREAQSKSKAQAEARKTQNNNRHYSYPSWN